MSPKYGGFFLKGLAGGLKTGFGIGQSITQMKWAKEQKAKLEKEQEKLRLGVDTFNSKVAEIYADGTISDEENLQLTTMYLTSAHDVKERIDSTYKAIQQNQRDIVDQNFKWFNLYEDWLGDLDPSNIPELFEYVKGNLKGEKAINTLTAYDSLLKKKFEARPEEPEGYNTLAELQAVHGIDAPYTFNTTIKKYIPTYKAPPTLSAADKKWNWAWEAYQKEEGEPGKIGFEEFKKYAGITPEKATGLEKQISDIKTAGEREGISTEEISKRVKNVVLGITTPSAKSDWSWASEVMFGSSDFVTGITKPGIIPLMISSKLNMGQPLTDEEKTEVRNNYNAIKGTLPSEVISIVESQLQRYGISLEAPTPIEPKATITPGPEPKKWWQFWKEGTPEETTPITPTPAITPTPETAPIPAVAPTPKVPIGAKEAMIPTMSKKELEEAIKGLDPSDPLYKLIYDEAVKRGYITK